VIEHAVFRLSDVPISAFYIIPSRALTRKRESGLDSGLERKTGKAQRTIETQHTKSGGKKALE
jgi:hypothetical protein